jgi:hypothetical protein
MLPKIKRSGETSPTRTNEFLEIPNCFMRIADQKIKCSDETPFTFLQKISF